MGPSDPALPRLPLALLRAVLTRADRDEILAALAAEYRTRALRHGRAAATRWLRRQTLCSMPALLRWTWWRERTGFVPHANAYRPGTPMLSSWFADAGYAARRLRARPAYALLAVVTLALGVGGTAAVYGITRGLLFEPLPYAHEREVGVFWKKTDWTEEEFLYLRGRVPAFRDIALYRQGDVTMHSGGAPARLVPGLTASAELFEVLGAPPLLGRPFQSGDDVDGAEPVAVLSHGLWRELGGDPSIVGRRLILNGRPRTIVGVMPRGFWFPDPSVRIWTAEPLNPAARSWNSTLIGRVSAGHDVRAMTAALGQITSMLDDRFDYPAQWDKTREARLTTLRDDMMGAMRRPLLATLGVMALILLIACANVAALMLGQVDARTSEFAVRLALGAHRRRLVQQLVVEALLLASAAGVLGAGLAWSAFRVLAAALPLGAWAEATAPDWRVFASAMAIALAGAVLVVLVPTMSLFRGNLRASLGRMRTGGLEGRGGRLDGGLVVAQVAFAMLIASGAALLARSVVKLYAIDPGVRTEGVAVIDVAMGGGLSWGRLEQTLADLTSALAQLPGARAAAATQTLPLRGGGYNLPLEIEGRPELQGLTTEYRIVTPGFTEIMGLELLQGRTITATDRQGAEPVVVINAALARRLFAGRDPLGQRLGDGNGRSMRVVGVVADAAERRLTSEVPWVRYAAVAQMPWIDGRQTLVVQAAPGADAVALLDEARRAVARVAPGVAVHGTTTMARVHDAAVGPARPVLSLLAVLTALALALGAVGVYGVIAHFAARRRRDWAIKIALGLPGSRVVRHLVGRGALLVALGIEIGALAAMGVTQVLRSLLYEVSTVDPVALVAAAGLLLAVGLLAAFVPARRAGRTDPAIVLREQ